MQRYEHGGDIYENAGIQLDFSVNTNPLGMPEAAKFAVVDFIDTFERYPDCKCRALRAALSKKHGVKENMILCGNGAADLIFRICACFQPKTALTLSPTFSEYERAVRCFGGEMRYFLLRETNGFELTDEVIRMLTPDTGVFFLCNPNNPTARLASMEFLCRIAAACAANDVLLVVDECFMEFSMGQSMVSMLSSFPKLLVLNAFTKFYGLAGLRLGYLMGDPALLARIASFGSEWSVSTAAQAAGLGALSEPDWAEKTRSVVEEERTYLNTELTKLGLTVFPGEANFLLLKCSIPLYDPLKKRSILVRGCDNFTGLDEFFIRIGIKTREKNTALLCAIREVLHG